MADAALDATARLRSRARAGCHCWGAPIKTTRVTGRRLEGDQTASVEEGVRLLSAGSRGERLLREQVNHRNRSSSADLRRASGLRRFSRATF